MRAAARQMQTHCFPLPGAPDLLDYYTPDSGFFFEHGGDGIVGVGAASTIVVPEGPDQVARAAAQAHAVLARVSRGNGPAPMVVGALPFDSDRAALLVVPRIAVVRRDGRTVMMTIGEEGTPEPVTMPHAAPGEPSTTLRVRPDPEPAVYMRAVEAALARIADGDLTKVVLARALVAECDHDFDVAVLLERLRARDPGCYVFGVRGFLGATPELLLSKRGSVIRSNPLAGTAKRGTNARADAGVARALLASAKDLREHALVVDAVQQALRPACDSLTVEDSPRAVSTSAVWHLSTEVRGTVRNPAEGALLLAALLHPTPAVCGTPVAEARAAITALEHAGRGLYAGLVGWVDADGDGEWAVALRCAEIDGNRARLFAGAGIVAGSEPAAELAETDAKFAALRDALGYA